MIETNSSINTIAMARAGLGIALLEPLTAHGMPLTASACARWPATSLFFGAISPAGPPRSGRRVQALSDALLAAASTVPGFIEHHASLQPNCCKPPAELPRP
ncbi:MAG: hypothetical protein QM777_03030 [Pseudorhodoferax sp.]